MWQFGIGFIVGVFLGSLTLCLASRSLTGESFWGRSYCDYCKKQLKWFDLFPIFSFLILKGKCRFCQKKLNKEYLFLEILMGFLVGLLFYFYLPQDFSLFLNNFTFFNLEGVFFFSQLFFKVFIICVLIAIVITDLKKGLIPDRITYPSILISFIYLATFSLAQIGFLYFSLKNSDIGKYLVPPYSDYFLNNAYSLALPLQNGLLAALILTLFFALLIFITKGRGMGGGDLKLGIFMGLVFGLPDAILALMLSFITGSIAGIGLIIFGKKKLGQTIPFGPFLALGSLITLFWGKEILNWYLSIKI